MPRRFAPLFSVILGIVWTATAGAATCDKAPSLDDWLQCRIQELQKENLKQSAVEKQSEQPSLSSASPSLLDKTSASDILGMGFELFTAGGNALETGGGSPTVTASLYALVSTARGQNHV